MSIKKQPLAAGWIKRHSHTSNPAANITRARALLASVVSAPIYLAFTLINGHVYGAASLASTSALSALIAICAVLLIRFTAHPSAAGHLFTLALANQTFGEMALNGGLQAPAAALSLLIVPAAIFSAGASATMSWALITLVGLFAISTLDLLGHLPANQLSAQAQQIDHILSLAAGIAVSAVMIIQFERQASTAIGKLKSERALFEHRALHDSLTGMPNRSHFYEHAQKMLENSHQEDRRLSILYFDIDGFKQVNDQLGHAIGDELLREFSVRLEAAIRPSDFAARLAGDEFAMITGTTESDAATEHLQQSLRMITHEPFELHGSTVNIGLSLGHVYTESSESSLDTLLNLADERMYADKSERRKAAIQTRLREATQTPNFRNGR